MSIVMKGKDGKTYKLYKASEIKKAWDSFGNLNRKDIKGDARFVVCRADIEEDALVLTTMMLRETGLTPSCSYYCPSLKKLYICCAYATNTEEMVEACCEIIKVFMGTSGLGTIERDWQGRPLFHDKGLEASDFYEDRCFPHGAANQDYGGMGKIHSHIPPEYAGII